MGGCPDSAGLLVMGDSTVLPLVPTGCGFAIESVFDWITLFLGSVSRGLDAELSDEFVALFCPDWGLALFVCASTLIAPSLTCSMAADLSDCAGACMAVGES